MTEKATIHHPRDKAIRGMVCGIPTFGMIHADFVASVAFQAMPINFGMAFVFPGHTPPLRNVRWSWKQNKIVPYDEWLVEEQPIHPPDPWILEIGEARNMIVQFCLDNNMEWLYFRDDDTIAPPDAINKLFSDKLPIVGGNYPSKQQPPHNLILQDGYLGGYDDWRFGEVVQCTNIGMGLTLIHTDVFRKIEKEIGRPWFKTVHGIENNDIRDIAPDCGRMTEDVYFCNKARHVGYKIHCDTGVQGIHMDVKSLVKHYYSPGLQHLVWENYQGIVNWYPPGDHPARKSMKEMLEHQLVERKKQDARVEFPEVVRLDLGAPKGASHPDFQCVDLYEEADYRGDARDLQWLLPNTGLADEIRASHLLEHLEMGEVPGVLKNWKRALKPGGQVEFAIPDFDWASEWMLRMRNADPPDYWQQSMMIYGAQRNPGDLHKTPFNMQTLRKLVEFTGFEIVDSFYTQPKDARIQRSAIIVAKRPVLNGETATENVRSLEDIRSYHRKSMEAANAKWKPGDPEQPMIMPEDPKEKVDEQLENFFREHAERAGADGGNGTGEPSDAGSKGERGSPDGPSQPVPERPSQPSTDATTSPGAAFVQPDGREADRVH